MTKKLDEDLTPIDLSKYEKRVDENRNKYTAIIDIINGEPVPEDKRVDMFIPNMMKGASYLREASIRKVLIFANFEETLKEVITNLNKNKIKYWKLQGTPAEIDNIAREFTQCETKCAMVVNSTQHCSGLNLQTATDLIFAHVIMDANKKIHSVI
jgi:SNF2 family DNA or RNA helicase